MNQFRTDLAFESRDFYLRGKGDTTLAGLSCETKKEDLYSLTRVAVESEEASEKLGKPIGNYVTIHSDYLPGGLYTKELSELLAAELTALLPRHNGRSLIMAAGLGNNRVTSDSIGPKVLNSLIVTRHLFGVADKATERLRPLCALAPGVLGITGIETAEIFSSVVSSVHPAFVIAIDALASRSAYHVGTTIQITDTGIHPGSGVNNRRNALTEKTLGVPVIVIGVPTVSDASGVVCDAVDEILASAESRINRPYYNKIVRDVLSRRADSMMVTPRDIDSIAERTATVIARGINLSVHPDLSYEDITEYVS